MPLLAFAGGSCSLLPASLCIRRKIEPNPFLLYCSGPRLVETIDCQIDQRIVVAAGYCFLLLFAACVILAAACVLPGSLRAHVAILSQTSSYNMFQAPAWSNTIYRDVDQRIFVAAGCCYLVLFAACVLVAAACSFLRVCAHESKY